MKMHKVINYHACLFDAHKKIASECQQINHLCIYIYYKTHDFSWVNFVNRAVLRIHKIVDICPINLDCCQNSQIMDPKLKIAKNNYETTVLS